MELKLRQIPLRLATHLNTLAGAKRKKNESNCLLGALRTRLTTIDSLIDCN